MSDPEDALQETRAALAPTLEATAAILPWVATARKPRFPPEVSRRWQGVCEHLAAIWADRHGGGLAGLRPAIFELCAAALDLGDMDCLRLAEALATATDRLEASENIGDHRLVAALSATFESLSVPDGLEHPAFSDRVRHFAVRLENCANPQSRDQVRSPVLNRLFIDEAGECLVRIHEALAVLPTDAYGIKLAADEIARLAEPLELDHIGALAGRLVRRLTPWGGKPADLDDSLTRNAVVALVTELEWAVAALGEG